MKASGLVTLILGLSWLLIVTSEGNAKGKPFFHGEDPAHVVVVKDQALVHAKASASSAVVQNLAWLTWLVLLQDDTDSTKPKSKGISQKWYAVGKFVDLTTAEPLGWMHENDLLLSQEALKKNGIYQKAIIVNHISREKRNIGGTRVRRSPLAETGSQRRELRPSNIYYVYDRREDVRSDTTFLLLGAESTIFNPTKPENTLIGWVERAKVFEWNTRVAAEYNKSTLGQRELVRIYEHEAELKEVITGNAKADEIVPLAIESPNKLMMKPSEPRFPIISNEHVVNGIPMWHIGFIGPEIVLGDTISGTLGQRAIAIMKQHGLNPRKFAENSAQAFATGWVSPLDQASGLSALRPVVLMTRNEVETLIALLGQMTTVNIRNVQKGWIQALEEMTGEDFDPEGGTIVPAEIIYKHLGIPVKSGILKYSFEEIGKLSKKKIKEIHRNFQKKLFLLRAVVMEKEIEIKTDDQGNLTLEPKSDKKYWFGPLGAEKVWLDVETYLP